MGSVGSTQSREPEDPWWQKNKTQDRHIEENVPEHKDTAQQVPEYISHRGCEFGEESWLKEIQDLGKIVQHLASENVKLLVLNRELSDKCDQGEQGRERVYRNEGEKQRSVNESRNVLSEELGSNELPSNMVQGPHNIPEDSETMECMKVKLNEYCQTIEVLKKDSSDKDETIKNLQYLLEMSEHHHTAEQNNIQEMKVELDLLKNKFSISEDKNKNIQCQLLTEREQQQKLLEENERLSNELQTIKYQVLPETATQKSALEEENIEAAGKGEQAKSLSSRAAAELDLFQKQLKVKREARNKALSAISAEMERLRRELNTERETRKNVAKELEDIKKMTDTQQVTAEVDHLRSKLSLEREEKERISKKLVQIQKESNEEIENILKKSEKEKDKMEYILGENKYMKEQLEETDQMLQQKSEENSQLQIEMESQKEKYQQQISALKDVIALSKQMLSVRENQVTHLKQTLESIEVSVTQKHQGSLTAGLRAEYETQIENIKTLKSLYEERTHVMTAEKEKLIEHQKELLESIESERKKSEALEVKLQEREAVISERNETVSNLQDQLSDALDQSRNLSYELSLINNMFTQILGSTDLDLDRLTKLLQENHDLMTEITTKGDSDEITASLPKLLLDLISNAEDSDSIPNDGAVIMNDSTGNSSSTPVIGLGQSETAEHTSGSNGNGATLGIQAISSNLPKVWKVLLELVSHHVEPASLDFSPDESKSCCYKSIETPYGPKNVISVSKTFLRLRDLILHKRSLQKEVTRLKQLNVHLETKLNDQERRLSLVSSELRKTWNVVDHMRIQHQQLHTHETVLRYELQQKRKMLNELKEELEYCREKWEEARQKNCQTEVDWLKLRKEFAMRKSKPQCSLNDSEESGFSEEREDESSNSESVEKSVNLIAKKQEDDLVNLTHNMCTGTSSLKMNDNETLNGSPASLPDLISATGDLNLSQTEVPSSQEPGTLSQEVGNNSRHIIGIVPGEMSAGPSSAISNDVSVQESQEFEVCPTVSLITLLKQQLSCFSKNLEIITAGLDRNENFRALQSIFTLPAIQIPEHLHPYNNANSFPSCAAKNPVNTISQEKVMQSNNVYDDESSSPLDLQQTKKGEKCLDSHHDDNACSLHSNDEFTEDLKMQYNCDPLMTSSSSNIPQSSSMASNEFPSSSSEEDCADVGSEFLYAVPNGSVNRELRESRSERLRRLEKQCQELFQKVTQPSAPRNAESKTSERPQENANESTRSLEEMLDARAARLKRLEEQSQQLFKKVTRTTHRSELLSNRLEELHEHYGSDDAASNATESRDNPTSSVSDNPTSSFSQSTSHLIPEPPPLPAALCAADQPAACSQNHQSSKRSLEDILDARAARLKRLEEQSQQLFKKVARTSHLREALSNRLEELHEHYGNNSAEMSTAESQANPALPVTTTHSHQTQLSSSAKACPPNPTVSSEPSTSTESHIPLPTPIPPACPVHDLGEGSSTQSLEDGLNARAARLKRLEEQSQQLFQKVTQTTHRTNELSNRVEALHEHFGSNDVATEGAVAITASQENLDDGSSGQIPTPPPLPETLRGCKLPTASTQEEIGGSVDFPQQNPSNHTPAPAPEPSTSTLTQEEEENPLNSYNSEFE